MKTAIELAMERAQKGELPFEMKEEPEEGEKHPYKVGIVDFDDEGNAGRVFVDYVLKDLIDSLAIDSFILDDRRANKDLSGLVWRSHNELAGKVDIELGDYARLGEETDILFVFCRPSSDFNYDASRFEGDPHSKDYEAFAAKFEPDVSDFFDSFMPLAKNLRGYKGHIVPVTAYSSLMLELLKSRGTVEDLGIDPDNVATFTMHLPIINKALNEKLDAAFPDGCKARFKIKHSGLLDVTFGDWTFEGTANDMDINEILSADDIDDIKGAGHEFHYSVFQDGNYENRSGLLAIGAGKLLHAIVLDDPSLMQKIQEAATPAMLYMKRPDAMPHEIELLRNFARAESLKDNERLTKKIARLYFRHTANSAEMEQFRPGLGTAFSLRSAGKLREAAQEVERLIDRFPGMITPYLNLQIMYSELGESGKKRELFERGIKSVILNSPLKLLLSIECLNEGKDEEAVNLLEEVVNHYDMIDLDTNMSIVQGYIDAFDEVYLRAKRREGVSQQDLQRATDLIDKLTEHLLDMNPHHELSREVFADRLMARGQYEEAATVYGQLCFDFTAAVAGGSGILTPDHVKIGERWHIKASKAIIGNDDTEIALQTLGQLDYSNPEEVHYLMGTAHAMEQRYEDAASHLNEALAVEKPDVRRDNIALGVVYSQTGKLDEALQCWKKAYDGEKDAVFDKLTEPITFSRDEVRKIMMEEVDLAEYVAAR